VRYPALKIQGVDPDFLLATLDDAGPSAVDVGEDGVIAFFNDGRRRATAADLITSAWPDARLEALEVDDEDWARRSQQNLRPVVVGRLKIVPTAKSLPDLPNLPDPPDLPDLVIAPSTGFGTGHHATTRLCLAALQTLDLQGRHVLDVGTGSGILALAASLLGAGSATGIDDDPDAIRAAVENLTLNPAAKGVTFAVEDLNAGHLGESDVVMANLTGALLQRTAALLLRAVRPGGHLILSGLLAEEREGVRHAFAAAKLLSETVEDEWVGLLYRRPEKIS